MKLFDFIKLHKLLSAFFAALIAALLAILGGFPWTITVTKDRWPVGDGSTAYPVISTYGQFEKYPDTISDYHDGIDIAVSAPPSAEDVTAIESGSVADVYPATDSVNYSIVILSNADPTSGYYYVHLDPAGLKEGDPVSAGDLLGTTIGYKDASGYDHVHVSRVQTIAGSTDDFPYKFVGNPLARLKDAAADTEPPSVGPIYCFDQKTGDRITTPEKLVAEEVDVVVKVSDLHSASTDKELIPYAVSVEITEKSTGEVVHTGELKFDGEFDAPRAQVVSTIYMDAADGVVVLGGGYTDRKFFVVPTNKLPKDSSAHWNTTDLEPGDYVIRVIATDVAGNKGEDTLTVTIPKP